MSLSDQLVIRNIGFVDPEIQAEISQTRLLFAGCGVGSAVAEAAARLGIRKFTLVDNDCVEIHNLNRQAFAAEDVGTPKVEALRKRIMQINPEAKVTAINDLVSRKNTRELVENADFIFDTIDFLDLENIVGLHDVAHELKKPMASLFTAGWGAVGIYLPVESRPRSWIRDLFEVGDGETAQGSYTAHFFKFFERMSRHLSPQVQRVMQEVMLKMRDGIRCPAPHVAAGAACASALGLKMMVAHLSSQSIPSAPKFIYLDLDRLIHEQVLELDP